MLLQILLLIFPWSIRKRILQRFCNFEIGNGSTIGFSVIRARKVVIGTNSHIGHLNYCKDIDNLEIGDNSVIGNNNRITGFSVESPTVKLYGHFLHIINRKCELVIGDNVGITSNHYFDCNGGIYVGDYAEIAGLDSIFMTHSIDLKECRQDAEAIHIGKYSFVGARVTMLKGSSVGHCCIIAAGAVVDKEFNENYRLIGGVPAHDIKSVEGYKFFERREAYVR